MTREPRAIVLADDGRFPNSRLPLLHYRGAIDPQAVDAEAFEALFGGNGWPAQWRAGVFAYHHYHSTAHEVLGIAAGEAVLMVGGPEGRDVAVTAGDVLVIPAGVAHCRLSASADFLVVGGYPQGQDWNLLRGEDGERPQADRAIAKVPMPSADPVAGMDEPLLRHWNR